MGERFQAVVTEDEAVAFGVVPGLDGTGNTEISLLKHEKHSLFNALRAGLLARESCVTFNTYDVNIIIHTNLLDMIYCRVLNILNSFESLTGIQTSKAQGI